MATTTAAVIDTPTTQVDQWRGFLSRADADAVFVVCEPLPWHEEVVRIAGKSIVAPRETCAAASEPRFAHYRYAGTSNTAAVVPFPPWLDSLERRVRECINARRAARGKPRLAHAFNYCFFNRYRGRGGIGKHTDSERDLEPGVPIASVSVGATRDFDFHPAQGGGRRVARAPLAHGDLVVMDGDCQREYKHSVPALSAARWPPTTPSGLPPVRYNLTFRRMKSSAH